MNKQRIHRFHVERFNLKKLDEVEGRVWGVMWFCGFGKSGH
jgi:hypothetical protein